jgi:hypothetical protein
MLAPIDGKKSTKEGAAKKTASKPAQVSLVPIPIATESGRPSGRPVVV